MTNPGVFGWPAWMLPIVGFVFMAVLMPLIHMFNIYSYRRRNRSVGTVQNYSITPDEYSVSGSLFETKVKWDAFIKPARQSASFYSTFLRVGRTSFRSLRSSPPLTCTPSDC